MHASHGAVTVTCRRTRPAAAAVCVTGTVPGRVHKLIYRFLWADHGAQACSCMDADGCALGPWTLVAGAAIAKAATRAGPEALRTASTRTPIHGHGPLCVGREGAGPIDIWHGRKGTRLGRRRGWPRQSPLGEYVARREGRRGAAHCWPNVCGKVSVRCRVSVQTE